MAAKWRILVGNPMRRSHSRRTCGAVFRILGMVLILGVLIPLSSALLALNFLWSLPGIAIDAWEDWRFHMRCHPNCGYTLWQAIQMQLRFWWADL
jgi:hypothetical protein